jgi:hypothetical protein
MSSGIAGCTRRFGVFKGGERIGGNTDCMTLVQMLNGYNNKGPLDQTESRRLKTEDVTTTVAKSGNQQARNTSSSRYLAFMDCDPPAHKGWTNLCFQEDVVSSPPDGPAGPGLNSSCSASHLDGNTNWVICAGRRLVAVHERWRIPGMLSLGDMWSKSQCFHENCTAPGIGSGWELWLGGQLVAIKSAFYNGSIGVISLGDELASDGLLLPRSVRLSL